MIVLLNKFQFSLIMANIKLLLTNIDFTSLPYSSIFSNVSVGFKFLSGFIIFNFSLFSIFLVLLSFLIL